MELEDVKLDTFYIGDRSAVRATHVPTGMVEIWNEGTYLENREIVLKKLAARVAAREPYIGDSGDETTYDNWGADGGR